MPALVLFLSDLRLGDNPALYHAAQAKEPLLCLYVYDEALFSRPLGAASKWWLQRSLASLQRSLEREGGRLVLRRGRPEEAVPQVMRECGASALYYNRFDGKEFDFPAEKERLFSSNLLFEPSEIATQEGDPYQVFTPFWKRCLKQGPPSEPLPKPRLNFYKGEVSTEKLGDWNLQPENSLSDRLKATWEPGEEAAQRALEHFIETKLARYAEERDDPAKEGTSLLSPHLRFGEISSRQVWHALGERPADRFKEELGWRDFCHHLLFHFPQLVEEPFQSKFERFPWREEPALFEAWKRGETGYPFVDAGMRQLASIGWMHNRARMVAASFLTKHLLIAWQRGEAWFWERLVDADPANNAANWQWVAGSGADAAPYFRIFNPILQGETYDPEGLFVKEWLPELKEVPSKWIHKPWQAPLSLHYPKPLVDHASARKRALELYSNL